MTGAGRALVVEVAGARYGLPLDAVREVVRVPEVAEVPRAPAHVLGVAMVRGRAVAILDARRLAGTPAGAPASAAARVVLLERAGETLGIRVDRVLREPAAAGEVQPLEIPA
jgi:purine-binding chemotaxis protein CheW